MKYKHNGKIVGELKDGVFYKKVKRSKHLMRMLNAWGISEKIIVQLHGICGYIQVTDTENNVKYAVSFEDFEYYALVKTYQGDTQLFLQLDKWDILKGNEPIVEERKDPALQGLW